MWYRGNRGKEGAGNREQAAVLRVDEKEVQENGMAYSVSPGGPSTKRERITRRGHEWHAAPAHTTAAVLCLHIALRAWATVLGEGC